MGIPDQGWSGTYPGTGSRALCASLLLLPLVRTSRLPQPTMQVCTPPFSSHLFVFLNKKRTFSLIKPQKTNLATTCRNASLLSKRGFGARERGRYEVSRHHTAMERKLLGKGGTSTFCAHISSPVGQSSSALLLLVLLGEECSALFMAMNSSLLFIQLSSACWLQPQPAPTHCMTPPYNNATARTVPPPAEKTSGYLSSAALQSHPYPPLTTLHGASSASSRKV